MTLFWRFYTTSAFNKVFILKIFYEKTLLFTNILQSSGNIFVLLFVKRFNWLQKQWIKKYIIVYRIQ